MTGASFDINLGPGVVYGPGEGWLCECCMYTIVVFNNMCMYLPVEK